MAKNENKVNPMCITLENGDSYTLDFSRESVKFAEDRRFNISELLEFPQTNIPLLFFYAFRKNHRSVARSKTDEILAEMGGLTKNEIERLVILYQQPNESLVILDEDAGKNRKATVNL